VRFNHTAVAELIQSHIDAQKELLEKEPEEAKDDSDKKNKDQGSIGNIW